jgi:hypothetical protein
MNLSQLIRSLPTALAYIMDILVHKCSWEPNHTVWIFMVSSNQGISHAFTEISSGKTVHQVSLEEIMLRMNRVRKCKPSTENFILKMVSVNLTTHTKIL